MQGQSLNEVKRRICFGCIGESNVTGITASEDLLSVARRGEAVCSPKTKSGFSGTEKDGYFVNRPLP